MPSKAPAEVPLVTTAAYAAVPSEEHDNEDDGVRLTTVPMDRSTELPAIAYAQEVHDEKGSDDTEFPTSAAASAVGATSTPLSSSASSLMLPEAQGLTWNDDFFDRDNYDDHDNVVAVFDLDYDAMESHYKACTWGCLGVTSFCFPSVIPFILLAWVPCYVNPNVRWNVRSRHVAVTRDGIVYCRDTRLACWGCAVPKSSKTIPFDQISDVQVVQGGDGCLNSPLSTVHIDTPSTSRHGNDGHHELSITGLYNPEGFRKVVLAMKRATSSTATGNHHHHYPAAVQAVSMIHRELGLEGPAGTTTTTATTATTSNEDLAVLLREIRDELRQSNQNGIAQASRAAVASATAPPPPADAIV